MSTIENSFLNISTSNPFERIANSTRLSLVSFVVLATLAALIFSLSAWANIKVASVYGTGAIMQHSVYTTLLPLTITLLIVRVLAMLISIRNTPTTRLDDVSSPATPVALPLMILISSPMPGKCFLKHQIGDIVSKGEVICEVECMKMLNSIRASESGKITEIYVQDGAILDANQEIVRIEKIS